MFPIESSVGRADIPRRAERVLDPKTIVGICDKFGLPFPGRITFQPEGTVSDVFSFDGNTIIKSNPTPSGKTDLAKEAEAYRFLRGKLPVPQVIGFDGSGEINGNPILALEQVEGETVQQQLQSYSPEQQVHLFGHMGAILGRLHSLPTTGIDPCSIGVADGGYPDHDTHLRSRYTDSLRQAYARNLLTAGDVEKLDNYFRYHTQTVEKSLPALLHGNFNQKNVISNEGKITGVVDWEMTNIGNPSEELAVVLYRTVPQDPKLIEAFLHGYERFSPISPQFNERRMVYPLMHYLRALLNLSKWKDQPEKQSRLAGEINQTFRQIIR